MKFPVRPELPTASVGSSQAPTAAVDNSAPSAICPESPYKSGNVVQTNGATSVRTRAFSLVSRLQVSCCLTGKTKGKGSLLIGCPVATVALHAAAQIVASSYVLMLAILSENINSSGRKVGWQLDRLYRRHGKQRGQGRREAISKLRKGWVEVHAT